MYFGRGPGTGRFLIRREYGLALSPELQADQQEKFSSILWVTIRMFFEEKFTYVKGYQFHT